MADPVGGLTGGNGTSADAVANGVRAALDGLSRTTVPHDKSATN
ncbi:hypothetical protein [Kutzneria sp. NPDC051319]